MLQKLDMRVDELTASTIPDVHVVVDALATAALSSDVVAGVSTSPLEYSKYSANRVRPFKGGSMQSRLREKAKEKEQLRQQLEATIEGSSVEREHSDNRRPRTCEERWRTRRELDPGGEMHQEGQ